MGACCGTQSEASTTTPLMTGGSQQEREARERRKKQRIRAVQELIETERTYVRLMQQTIEHYMQPLAEQPKLISPKDHKVLFSDMQIIFGLNEKLLADLEDRFTDFDNDRTRIGDLFRDFVPYFRMYQNYLNNYDRANEMIPRLFKKQAFCTFCDEARRNVAGNNLESLLILPIQRLPRYKLCLTEVVKNTEYGHPDLNDLEQSLEEVSKTTALINERMREFEQRQTVRTIESRFSSKMALVKPHRRFIKEGELTKIMRTGKHRRCTFFLFNDIIIYGSGNAGKLRLHNELPIDRAFWTKEIRNHAEFRDNAFELYTGVKSFIVIADSPEVKRAWLQAFSQAIQELMKQPGATQQRELSAPLLVPDDWSDVCQMPDCETKFSFVNRRHHCRYCGKLICSKCGNHRLASKTNKSKIVKPVCTVCFGHWHKQFPAPKNGVFEEYEQGEENSDEEDRKEDTS